MFFTPMIRRSVFNPAFVPAFQTASNRACSPVEHLFDQVVAAQSRSSAARSARIEQDDHSVSIRFDMPGIAKEQLSIGIEGNIVRIESLADAPRHYKLAYELPQDIDIASSQAKLELGVLTLKLGKLQAASRVTPLTVD